MRAFREHGCDLRRSLDDVLEVVEQEQQAPPVDEIGERSATAESPRGCLPHVGRIGDGRERYPPHSVGVLARGLAGRMKCEPRLPRPAGTRKREQPRVTVREHLTHGRELLLAAEKRSPRDREIRPVKRLQGRELAITELKDPLRRTQVLQPVLAEVAELVPVDEGRGRVRDEHLSPVAGGRDASGTVDVLAHIPLRRKQRRTRVEPHTHRKLKDRLRLARRRQCTGGSRKGDEKRIPLSVNLDPALPLKRLPQNSPMLSQPRCVLHLPKLMQKPRRTLDVREQEGDGAARQLAHEAEATPLGDNSRTLARAMVQPGCRIR